MKSYKDLTTNEKINLKQYAINLSGDKRAHFLKPNEQKKLNELQINFGLSDFSHSNSRKYKTINGTLINTTNRN